MSTFFRSAAMTLLSRTLQTLLSKYLSDVDVEGVNLPSLYSSDGHSGWGVRLSNVKLREGAKLMDLPGKRKIANRRKHRRRKSKRRDRKAPTVSHNVPRAKDSQLSNDSTKEATVDSATDQSQSSLDEQNDAANNNPMENTSEDSPTSRTILSEREPEISVTASETADPDQPTSSSWFFWPTRKAPLQRAASIRSIPATVDEALDETDADDEKEPLDPLAGFLVQEQPHDLDEKSVLHAGLDGTEHNVGESANMSVDIDIDEEVEDQEEELGPLVLRLGKGGTVGTLDIRLVGKDIHVFVEDAFLTIEAVRLKPNVFGDPETEGSNSNDSKKKKKEKPKQEIKTVGDRVLAENAIARAFSMIPNLFLRDISVRFIIRDAAVETFQSDQEASAAMSEDYGSEDSVVELGIEFLSVTDGSDFLARFRGMDEGSSDDDSSEGDGHDNRPSAQRNIKDEPYDENEYQTKRIRTGRGPEGGIVIRLYPAAGLLPDGPSSIPKPGWARTRWLSTTEFCLLRCSGLDVQARVFLGTKQELSIVDDTWYADDYEEYTVDAMLFGVDYIAPGPQPPLPPMENQTGLGENDEQIWTYEAATRYQTDSNGISSSGVQSSFHRVARDLKPIVCENDHLPCEYCRMCWFAAPGCVRNHPLDAALPMAGLVLNLSMRDPLEVNVDRSSLEVIGQLIAMVTSSPSPDESSNGRDNGNRPGFTGIDDSERSTYSALSRSSTHGSLNSRSTSQYMDDSSHRSSFSTAASASKKPDSGEAPPLLMRRGENYQYNRGDRPQGSFEGSNVAESFPSYMQPEKIQIIGMHVPEIKLRIHVLRENDELVGAFSYWDICAKCVTMDHQRLNASETSFQDLRFDVGHFVMREYKGMEKKQLASVGLRQRIVDFDEMTVETLLTEAGEHKRPPWPSTAAALLDVPPPLETLAYESRERHALQVRYIALFQPGIAVDSRQSHASIRVGAISVGTSWGIKNAILAVVEEAKAVVLGPSKASITADTEKSPELVEQTKRDSLMKYKLRVDGGHIRMEPLIDLQLPLTILNGESSSRSGAFFETMLERVGFACGIPTNPSIFYDKSLSLRNLAELPENVRLRILLFLKDLKPLETALGVKPEANSFLRCRAVNKQIVKIAKKSSRYSCFRTTAASDDRSDQISDAVGRRQELLTELLKLDDDALEDLLMLHRRSERRTARKKSNGR